jgi:hypothetical protein
MNIENHEEHVGRRAEPDHVLISVLTQRGDGVSALFPVDVLSQMDDVDMALDTPTYAQQKAEVIRRFNLYLQRPGHDQGVQVSLLAYHALCALDSSVPARLSNVVRVYGGGCVTIMTNPRKRTFAGAISETVPSAELLSDSLEAAKYSPTVVRMSPDGWSAL